MILPQLSIRTDQAIKWSLSLIHIFDTPEIFKSSDVSRRLTYQNIQDFFQKDAGFHLVHVLTAGTTASEGVPLDFTFVDNYVELFGFGVLENDNLDGWFVMPEQAVLSFVPYDNLNAHLLISADPEKETAVEMWIRDRDR